MKAALRILHLEDVEPDRELVRLALAADYDPCDIVYAVNEGEFAAALARQHFDLILSDFTLPGYDGGSALALARQKCPEVPYLFVSGTIGEEQAIESLKSGATDYVLKNRLARLGPAVSRALREADERARRCRAEDASRNAEARFRDIFENAFEGIYQATPQGRLVEVNQAMAHLCGYNSPVELCAAVRDVGLDLHVDSIRHTELLWLVAERGEVRARESQIRRKDGTLIWISENTRAVRSAQGGWSHFVGMVTDITARRAAECALRKSEERFREMADRIEDVFYITALDTGRWLYVSPAYAQIWGQPLATLSTDAGAWTAAVVPEDRAMVLAARQQLADGHECHIHYRISRPDGSLRWIEDRSYLIRESAGDPRRAVGLATDITQRRELEGQLLQAQKMEAIGQLAGGLAHDFNNILTVVIGYARILLDGGTLGPEDVALVTPIFTAGTRAANLTRQLLVFSLKQTVERQVIDLNDVTDEISQMLRRLIGDHIKLILVRSPAPLSVDADAGMLEQVLMNLAVNARDAMPAGGTLTITLGPVKIVDAAARHHPAARPGEFVSLEVRDTGSGIAPEHLARVFEPFFTTKGVGRGTGLGLAMAFGIVQKHLGWIELESRVGVGTCFRLLLPAVPAVAVLPAGRPVRATRGAAAGGAETMLLVEDDPAVREFAVAVLRGQGYRVLQAGSGPEALDVWKWHGARITLLITDLVMPDGLNGLELAERLRREKPGLRVVLTTGYANETSGEEFHPPPDMHFVPKPYKPQVLAQAVRDALDHVYH